VCRACRGRGDFGLLHQRSQVPIITLKTPWDKVVGPCSLPRSECSGTGLLGCGDAARAGGKACVGSFRRMILPEDLQGAVCIGAGCDEMAMRSHEILIAAGPDPDGRRASIRLQPDGTILVNEKPVGSDLDIVEGIRAMLYQMLRVVHIEQECSVCHRTLPRPVIPGARAYAWVCWTCRDSRRQRK
jgi:hypothetical protein